MSADPSSWSDDKLLRHAAEFCDLPVTAIQPVMSDDDAEAHGDILYLHGLLEELTAAKVELEREAKGPDGFHGEAVFWLCWLHRNAVTFLESSATFTPSWGEAMAPLEAAGEEIAAWRADRRAKIEADYDRPAYIEQGPGADWGNGIEPETLREETDVDQWGGLRAHDGNNADPAVSENPENGGDMGVDPVDNERQTNPSVHQRETRLDESLTWNNEDDTAQDSPDESLSETSNNDSQTNTESDGEASSTSTKSSPTGSTTSSKQPDTNDSAPDSGDSDNESSDE